MGQSQSTREAAQDHLSYHPSAVEFNLSSNASKRLDNGQKRSGFGPIRNRAKDKKIRAFDGMQLHSLDLDIQSSMDSPLQKASTSILSQPSNIPFQERGHRISRKPINEVIIEAPEIDFEGNTSDQKLRSKTIFPSLATKIGLDGIVSPASTSSSPSIAQSRKVPTSIDDGVLTDRIGRPNQRRHSWHSGMGEANVVGSLLDRTASIQRPSMVRWTSHWEDHRGRARSNDEELTSLTSSPPMQHDEEIHESSSRVKRKQVPVVEDWNDFENCSEQTTPIEIGREQRILWTASIEELPSRQASYMSRASATTDALHSHVDQLRAGPSYQVDPNASDLLLSSDTTIFPTSEVTIDKKQRGSKLMGKLKERVRKTSGALLFSSSLVASSPWPSKRVGRNDSNNVDSTFDGGEDEVARTHSPSGTEILAAEAEQHQQLTPSSERTATPIAYIGRSPLSALERYEQFSPGIMQLSTSSSTFTSLAFPLEHTLVPPPRRPRKKKTFDSNSNIDDSPLRSGSPPRPDLAGFAADLDRLTSLDIDREPSIFRGSEIGRHGRSTSEATSRKQTSTYDSSHHRTPSLQSWEADRSGYSTVQLSNDTNQTAGLSPFQSRQVTLSLHDDEDVTDDGLTLMESLSRDVVGRHRQSQSCQGVPPIPFFTTETSPRKRPLPTPPGLTAARTHLSPVEGCSSSSSTFAESSFGGQMSVASMQKHTHRAITMMGRKPLPPIPSISNEETNRNRSLSLPATRASPYLQHLSVDDDITPSPLLQPQQRSPAVQSWTSADGPWQAEIIALPTQSAVRVTSENEMLAVEQGTPRTSSISFDLTSEEERISFEGAEPVPFAETAMQASLAVLAALERCEQGDELQSRWAREKLLGSAKKNAVLYKPTSTSELSDYSNSRSRRRVVPYTRSKEELSCSKADERGRRKARKRKDQPSITLDKSQAEDQTLFLTLDRSPRSAIDPLPADTSGTNEDWDEKIVPALTKRLELEAEEGAKMTASINSPSKPTTAVKTLSHLYNEEKKKPSSSTLSRTPKIRRGYGCEDIQAWQASLGIASIPITLL
jgi:hypothetical protein